MDMEEMEVTGLKGEQMQVDDKGNFNLVSLWANRGFADEFDLRLFFDDKGVERFVRYLESQLEEPCIQIEKEENECWVHPLIMYKYLSWCEPQVMALGMDLYHQYTEFRIKEGEKVEAEEKDATRH